MIWTDNAFPYTRYVNCNFETIATDEYDEGDNSIMVQIDYCKKYGFYRVTNFLNGHWNGDVVFSEVEKMSDEIKIYFAYCPICNKEVILHSESGHCENCGHHLNANGEK